MSKTNIESIFEDISIVNHGNIEQNESNQSISTISNLSATADEYIPSFMQSDNANYAQQQLIQQQQLYITFPQQCLLSQQPQRNMNYQIYNQYQTVSSHPNESQTCYAQDAVPQYSQEYITAQLNGFVPKTLALRDDPSAVFYDTLDIKSSKYRKIYGSLKKKEKSQTSQPKTKLNENKRNLKRQQLLIHGFTRQFACWLHEIFTNNIPTDILNVIAHFYENQLGTTKLISYKSYDGFDIKIYENGDIFHYESINKDNDDYEIQCTATNISIPTHIINAYNASNTGHKLVKTDDFNIIILRSKSCWNLELELTKSYKPKYKAVMFRDRDSIAFQLELPTLVSDIGEKNKDCIYSDKDGLILIDQYNIYNFSFQQWDWATVGPFKPRVYLKLIYNKSSYVMIDSDHLFMTLPRGNAYIANLNNYRSCYTAYSDYGWRTKPVICCDETWYKRVYICATGSRDSTFRLIQYYDIRNDSWNTLEGVYRRHCRIQQTWLDDIDKNLLYGLVSWKYDFITVDTLDLRSNQWCMGRPFVNTYSSSELFKL